MKKTFVICLTLLMVVGATTAFARVAQLPRVLQGADILERPGEPNANLPTSTSSDTFVWGPYDFETGWQGWTDVDYNLNTSVYGHVQDLSTVPNSRGNGSLFTGLVEWTGTLGANACGSKACFPGYDNNSNQMVFKGYTFGASPGSITFKHRSDSEPNYDYTYLIVCRAGVPVLQTDGSYAYPGTEADRDTLASWTGYTEGSADSYPLSAYANKTVGIVFQSNSDGGYSDGDCNYNSQDGLWEMDDVNVNGDLTTWDAGANGWTYGKDEGLGTYAQIQASGGLPNLDPCPANCGIGGNCITIYNALDPTFHGVNQNEAIVSAPILLTQNGSYPVGSYVVQFDVYANLPLQNGNFYFWHVRYSPVETSSCCLDANDWSAWLDENTIYYGGGTPVCTTGAQFNLSAKVPGHATQVQVAVGVINYPYYVSIAGGNQSPYFDNIQLRAAKVSAPAVVQGPWDLLQDAYPDAGSFAAAKSVPAKIDSGLNNYSPGRSHTRMGDSMTCSVAMSCNASQATEVDLLFKVTPGPCLNTAHAWWVKYTSMPKVASGPFAGFAVARMDTARTSTGSNSWTAGYATFMTEFNEAPVAAGTAYAGLGDWSSYTGGVQGVQIMPDDLFTPGTHIEWALHTTYIPGVGDYYAPDQKYGNGDGDRVSNQMGNQNWASQGGPYSPSGTFVEETEVLPLTTQDGNTGGCASAAAAHCFLYVDKFDQRGAQLPIENAFRNLKIAWDRYDVRAPTSAMGNDLGNRYSAGNCLVGDHCPGPLPSLVNEVYKAILWNTGNLNSTDFSYGSTSSGADAGDAVDLLDSWVRTTADGKFLWVSGDGVGTFLNKTGVRLTFLNTTLGVTYIGSAYRSVSTVWGINLTGLGPDCSTGLAYGLRANWCPQRRSFNRIDKYTGGGLAGANAQSFKYPDAGGTWYASVQDIATTGGFNFRTEMDGWSLDQLSQSGVTSTNRTNETIQQWSAIALSTCFTGCFGSLTTTNVGEQGATVGVNSLGNTQSPLKGGTAVISYRIKEDGPVAVRVYDVSGRLIQTLVNEPEKAGEHTATWNASSIKGGVYFYQIEAKGWKSAKKIVLVN